MITKKPRKNKLTPLVYAAGTIACLLYAINVIINSDYGTHILSEEATARIVESMISGLISLLLLYIGLTNNSIKPLKSSHMIIRIVSVIFLVINASTAAYHAMVIIAFM